MRELQIKPNEAGQRFDKFLKKYLNLAPAGFIYKMLRKKNITLNEKKAEGCEILNVNDTVRLFLAEETLEKFHGRGSSYQPVTSDSNLSILSDRKSLRNLSILSDRKSLRNFAILSDRNLFHKLSILYEDEDILLVNKPAGVLSQKAKPSDVSMNEIMIDYLVNHGTISIEELSTFKPSVCNRLDRNTSGILSFGKTLRGVQMLSKGFKEKQFEKYYLCVVNGQLSTRTVIDGFLVKDGRTNRVRVGTENACDTAAPIRTEYLPVCGNGRFTFLKVRLHTGKTHQIRAHLSSMGYPVVGDFKYGDKKLNGEVQKKYNISSQLLHAYEMVIPEKKLDITAPVPEAMMEFLKGEQLWESGRQEDLEALH